MAFISEKDFECILCGQRFTMLYGDLIVQEDLICEKCQEEMLQLNSEVRRKQIIRRLATTMPEREQDPESLRARERLENRIFQKFEKIKKGTSQ